MNAIGMYLLAGVVVWAVLAIVSELTEAPAVADAAKPMALAERLSQRFRNDPGVQLSAGLAFVLLWPMGLLTRGLAAAGVLKAAMFEGWGVRARPFRVRRRDLLERLTVAEIEARELVVDPLGAVPPIPFGHLNATWVTFRAEESHGGTAWSFSARWCSATGADQLVSGYVWVRRFRPRAFVLTTCQNLTD